MHSCRVSVHLCNVSSYMMHAAIMGIPDESEEMPRARAKSELSSVACRIVFPHLVCVKDGSYIS